MYHRHQRLGANILTVEFFHCHFDIFKYGFTNKVELGLLKMLGQFWLIALKDLVWARDKNEIALDYFKTKYSWPNGDDVARSTRFYCSRISGRYKSSPLTIILVPRIKASGRGNSG